jgi:hypothetical protein
MGPLDTYIVYKFIRLLTTPWDETEAFRLGVIDASGKLVVDTSRMTDAQEKSYTLFNRLVFNIKRLIEKVPGGRSKIGTYAAALLLFREQMGDDEGVIVLERSFMSYLKETKALDADYLTEQYLPEEMLPYGNYKLVDSMLDVKGDSLPAGTLVLAPHNMTPKARVLGVDVYELKVAHTGKTVVVSHEDIHEI